MRFISLANLSHCRLLPKATIILKVPVTFEADNTLFLCNWTKIQRKRVMVLAKILILILLRGQFDLIHMVARKIVSGARGFTEASLIHL